MTPIGSWCDQHLIPEAFSGPFGDEQAHSLALQGVEDVNLIQQATVNPYLTVGNAVRRVILVSLTLFVVSILVIGSGGVSGIAHAQSGTISPTHISDFSNSTDTIESSQLRVLQSQSSIQMEQRLSRNQSAAGTIHVVHQYTIPSEVSELEVDLDEDATVRETTGFRQTGPHRLEWRGTTRQPTITYDYEANTTTRAGGPIAGPGRHLYADVGTWGIVVRPPSQHQYRWFGTHHVGFERSLTTDDGAVGDAIAFLGDHEEFQHEAHGQTFRLIVPEAADLHESPDEIFDSLTHASDSLRVGERDESVFIIAAPTGEVQWAVQGLQAGDADMWVRDVQELNEPNNVWLHEYVHTRQGYDAAPNMKWFTEGTAVYYAALFTFEQERIDFETFADRLARGEQPRFDAVHLADPDTWEANADYHVGALVAGEIDRQIRVASDGSSSLQTVFRTMNTQEEQVDLTDFVGAVQDSSSNNVAQQSQEYIETTTRPAMWTPEDHGTAFQVRPAAFEYRLPPIDVPGNYGVEGPYRNESITGTDQLVLVPGETLTVPTEITNIGDRSGTYSAVLRRDDFLLRAYDGRLEPTETTTDTVSQTFESTGSYELQFGNDVVSIQIVDPETANITSITTNQTTATSGESVQITITVTNPTTVPAAGDIRIKLNDDVLITDQVRLGPGSSETISYVHTFDQPGSYDLHVASHNETITISVPEEQPGLTFIPTVIAVIVALVIVRLFNVTNG